MLAAQLHKDGPRCSRIVAGAWRWHNVSAEVVDRLVHTALDAGITTFDHADIYGDHSNEAIFGQVLSKNPSLRSRMQLITKCGIRLKSAKRPENLIKHYDTSSQYIKWSVENSLKALHTDTINLLLIHRPDPLMDPDEVVRTFEQLKSEGKVMSFGVSNFTSSQFRLLQSRASFPLVTNQIELSLPQHASLFNGDTDTLMEFGAAPMAWSPLGGGKPLNLDDREVFGMCAKHNATQSQLLLAWLLAHPSRIFPIIGTTQPERIQEAARAMEIKLTRQDWFEMLRWVTGKEVA